MSNTPKIDDLLEGLPKSTNRVLDRMPDLVSLLLQFLNLKEAGDERVTGLSLKWFYTNKLKPQFPNAPSYDAVRAYVADVLIRRPDGGRLV
jgi:hypothetical protein